MKRYIKASVESELKKYENSGEFDSDQLEQIRKGLEAGVDVSWYSDPEYRYGRMEEIRKGLENGIDVSWYVDPEYDYRQMQEIRWGLEKGLDVSKYADPKYNSWQMQEIRKGFEQGLDISWYADPKYGGGQMEEIRLGLKHGLDVSIYADSKYDYMQMVQIREGLEQGLDVSVYADPKYDWGQMYKIRNELEEEKPQKPKRVNWKSIVRQLEKEAEDGTDSFYELTDAGDYVTSICQGIEDKLGIFAEPSIQAGRGSIDFSHDEWGSASMDYEYFNDCVYDMAVESKNVTEFKNRYKGFLEDLDWE